VLVVDPPEVVARKLRSAVTDSGREVRRGEGKEGIANLIEIAAVATGRTAEEVEAAYDGAGYGQFKTNVAEAVVEYLRPVRERYLELRADPAHLQSVLQAGAERAREVSGATVTRIKERMGFAPAL
jgi:tryptophanyl-tRNA synthetase